MGGNPFMSIQERATPLSVSIFSGRVWVTLNDQRVIGLPLAAFPWLEKATPEQQQHYQATAISLYWPDLEDGIDMEYFTGEWSLSDA
jgi:hypothetical protein